MTLSPLSTRTRLLRRGSTLLGATALLASVVTVGSSAVAADGPAHHARTHLRAHGIHVPRAYFGLHDSSMQAYGHVPFGALRLWDAGVRWSDIETGPGVYSWGRLDSLVAAAQAHHVQVTLVLAMTPSFYATQPSQAPRHLHAYTRYVRAVMHRYRSFHGGRGITAYQVWNEGNIGHFWSGTPHRLARLTRIVDRVRNHVDPAARVIGPSFAIRLRYQRTWFSRYLHQRVDGRPVWRWYDANALSIYPRPTYHGRIGGPEDAMHLVGLARQRLRSDGVPRHMPLWATEINYGVDGGGLAATSATPISQRRQVANVLRTYLLGAAHGLKRVFWYRYDWGRAPDGGTYGNTLLAVPGDPSRITHAGRAVRIARAWLRGRLVGTHGRAPCARGRHGTYTCTVRYRGGTRTIYWNPRREVRVRVPASARLVSLSGRGVRRAASTMTVGYRPVMVSVRR